MPCCCCLLCQRALNDSTHFLEIIKNAFRIPEIKGVRYDTVTVNPFHISYTKKLQRKVHAILVLIPEIELQIKIVLLGWHINLYGFSN
jgi:hypothetical protein